MFTEYYVIQFNLYCLMVNIKQRSAPTGACTVSLVMKSVKVQTVYNPVYN